MFLLLSLGCYAQADVEYRMEIGAGVGATTCYGDFNASLTKNLQPAGEVIFRRCLNPNMAVRIAGTYSKLKGDYKSYDSSAANPNKTYYPNLKETGYSFSNTMADLSVTYEYNFWAYGTGKEYRGAKRVAPFISLGLGFTYAQVKEDVAAGVNKKNVVTPNIPLGIGVKYRYGDRTNISLDWQMHFSMSDELDGISDPYGIKSSGLFKNTDCYSVLTLGVTYSFSEKCRTCHKE